VPIEIPPLRERRADIEPLATHLLARVAARQGRALRFSPDALRAVLDYPWPGNVRELENALEYAVAVCKGQTLLLEDLPVELLPSNVEAVSEPALSPRSTTASAGPVPDLVHLKRTLEAHRWRRLDAARALGISRATLWRRMREAGLSNP